MESSGTNGIYPQVKLRLVKKTPFLGPGPAEVFRQIDSLGAVRAACGATGISYSKAWKMIHTAEEAVGYEIVARQAGGINGGQAHLTEKGRELVRRYEEYEKQMKEIAEELFQNIFFGTELL